MTLAGLMNLTAVVKRRTVALGTMGGQSTTRAAIGTMKLRLEALSGTERAIRGAEGVSVTHRLYCNKPVAFDIHEADELTIGGALYQVHHVNDPQRMGHHLEIEVEELKSGS